MAPLKGALALVPPVLVAVGLVLLVFGVERWNVARVNPEVAKGQFQYPFLFAVGAAAVAAGAVASLALPSLAGGDEEVVVTRAPALEAPAEDRLSKDEREALERAEQGQKALEERIGSLAGALKGAEDEVGEAARAAGEAAAAARQSSERLAGLEGRVAALEGALAAARERAAQPAYQAPQYQAGAYQGAPQQATAYAPQASAPYAGPAEQGAAQAAAAPAASIVERISPVGAQPQEAPRRGRARAEAAEGQEGGGGRSQGFPCPKCGFSNPRRTAFCARCGGRM